ncbi:TonB-dependent receptor [Massilia sp. erpn]|uniref:TonB-dependent receptor n=1 Tax=Massilia sp. erpn TaxID=2738142 RepID=UPI002107E0A1|nr:TonB-dependent receptor [Massilia sp. erpn]UTY56115.1 TonB-dependent receptor [Massilia sp. erpn]
MKHNLVLKQSVIAVALAVGGTQFAVAQQAAEPAVQKVFVTGSNIKRAEKEGSSPIQTLGAKQIAATGANTVSELLHSIPAFGSGASVDGASGGFSNGAATASLRGLGSSSTLILLNGRRIAAAAYADPSQGKSATYDLNSIPVSAIERVEVFKDGASAVYGSDAIAGVINFITKTDYKGGELTLSASANDDGEFRRKGVSGVVGFGDLEKYRVSGFLAFDLGKRDSTLIGDQKDVENGLYRSINGRMNGYGSYLSASPFFYREKGTSGAFYTNLADRQHIRNRTDCDPSQQITGDKVAHNLSAASMLIGRTFCNYDTNRFNEVQSDGKDANLLSKVTFQVSENITAFAEMNYSRNERSYLGAPLSTNGTQPSAVFGNSGQLQNFQMILPIGHPDNPFTDSRAAAGFRMINSPGGSKNVNETYRGLVGLKGTTGNWDWETGLLWNRSEREGTSYGALRRDVMSTVMTQNRRIADLIADPNATTNLTDTGYSQVKQLDAKASTTLGKLPGGDIGLAFGGEIRQESIHLTPDAQLQNGNIIGRVGSFLDGQRTVKSAFVEIRTPFLKNWEMDFAGRYDKYPAVKSFVPKVGSKWTINERVAVRGSFAKGFRAPALMQIAEGGVRSFNNVKDTLRCPDSAMPLPGGDAADCVGRSISSMSASNPALQPEKSKSYSLGLILNPMKDLDILVDWYRIKKTNETALLSSQTVIDHPNDYPQGKVIRNENSASFLTDANGAPIPGTGPILQVNRAWVNQGSTEVSGLDFEVAYRKSLGDWGRVTTNLNWSHLYEYRRAEHPGDVAANTAGSAGGLSDWNTTSGDNPRNRASASVNWTKGVHSLTGTVDFIGPVSLLRRSDNATTYAAPYCHYGKNAAGKINPGGNERYTEFFPDLNNCRVQSWTTFGVNYNYTGFKNLTLSLNIKNLFDTKAPYDVRNGTATEYEGYNPQLHNGMGRYFRLSANYKF